MATTRLQSSTHSPAPCKHTSLYGSGTQSRALTAGSALRRAPDRAARRVRQGTLRPAMARLASAAALVGCLLSCAAACNAASSAPQAGCRAAVDALRHCSAGAAGEARQAHCCLPFRFLQEFGCFWCAT